MYCHRRRLSSGKNQMGPKRVNQEKVTFSSLITARAELNELSMSVLGVAVASTRQFFTKLAEDKDDEDPEFGADESDL